MRTYSPTVFMTSFDAYSTGSGNLVQLADDGTGSAAGKFVQLEYQPITSGSYGTAGKVLASSVTEADCNAWGAIDRTTSDIHVVALSDNSSNYVHRRGNPATFSNGDSIGALAYGTNSGIRLISDGTSVWAGAFDTSKRLQVNKWTSGSGWGGWSVQEAARTNTPSYLTGTYNGSNQILWAWTELNGSNYDIIGSVMSTTGGGGLTVYGASLLGAA